LYELLLGVSRGEVLDHLRTRELPFCEDPTNVDTHRMRNRVRHELLPYLESRFHPRIKETLSRTAQVLASEDEWLDGEAREAFSACARREGSVLVLPRSALKGSQALARRILRTALDEAGGLRGVGASHLEGILALAASRTPSGRRLPLPGRREAVFHFDTLRIGPTAETSSFAVPLPIPGKVFVPGGVTITARSEEDPEVSHGWEAIVTMPWDAALTVRSPRAGDRVRLGGRSRSLNRLLMERRVPRDARRMLPVVDSGERVVFVPGETLDLEEGGRRVRIAAATA
jgi:tRNA(Ile)-lysidine synthase